MPGTEGTKSRSRRVPATPIWAAGLAILLLLLLPSPAPAGEKVPSLASTAQYKAFTAYVKKLDGLVGQPVPAARKAAFEAALTTKKKAAAHKANALFHRVSEKAHAKFTAKLNEQAAAVRRSAEDETETIEAETAGKLGHAASSYHAKLAKVGRGHRKFESRTHEQIASLRAEKAAAAEVAQKEAIQEQINRLSDKIKVKRQGESEKRAKLKTGFRAQKQRINAAAARQEAEIAEVSDARIEEIQRHWDRAYKKKRVRFNAKRQGQLGYLGAKLEKGRTDIATMPAAG